MGRKVLKVIGIVLGCIVLFAGILYLVVSGYYRTRFMPNTTINDHNAYALTASQMNEILCNELKDYSLDLKLQGETVSLKGSDFDYRIDFEKSLNEILRSQKPFEWVWYFIYPTNYEARPDASYDEEKLQALLDGLDSFKQEEKNAKALVSVENRMNHFTFRDDRKDVLNTGKATVEIKNAIVNGNEDCDLTADYEAPKATAIQQKALDAWKTIDKIQNAKITYVDDELSLTLDKHDFASWIICDEKKQPVFGSDGKPELDHNKVLQYMEKVSDVFDTDKKGRTWHKYKGGTVQIPSKDPGFIVDEEAEAESVAKTILNGYQQQREPIYSQEGKGHGNAEVGDTYVEVDLSNQKLYYIEGGKLALQSDVVTGCKRYHNDTPSMITDIYFMQEGRTLRGENYATFVYYWMAFYNHYGLHDATWRSKFGGDIYLTDGSHGCVNMPKENAAKLYSMVHVGTPVVLYE